MDKWADIRKSIDDSPKNIKVLTGSEDAAKKALAKYFIPADTGLGTVISNCGGIVVDDRLRIYGAGEIDITVRNELYNIGAMIAAEDIYGGLFFFGSDNKLMYYAPDTLEPEETNLSYTPFLYWAITGDTDGFYSDLTYPGWQKEAAGLLYDQGIAFYPFLWTKEGKNLSRCTRNAVPMTEIVGFELDMNRKR